MLIPSWMKRDEYPRIRLGESLYCRRGVATCEARQELDASAGRLSSPKLLAETLRVCCAISST